MPTAKKLKSGTWRCQAYANGVRKSFCGATRREAELLAMTWQNTYKVEAIRKTVGKCVDEYIDAKLNILSPTTITGYRNIRKNWMRGIDMVPIQDIDDITVQKWVNELALRYAPKTVRSAHGLLVAVLNVYAPEIHLRTTLPPKRKNIKQLPDVQDVLKAVMGSDVELECLLALWCGLRMSEVRGLKVSDIRNGVATIRETVVTVSGEHIVKQNTKTYDSTRMIVLPEHILRLVDGLPKGQDRITVRSGQGIYKRFSRLLEEHGVQHMTFHDLRHMNASAMLALGVPDKYAMERGGWSSPNVMKSVYQHTITAERRRFDEVIDSYFQQVIDGLDK